MRNLLKSWWTIRISLPLSLSSLSGCSCNIFANRVNPSKAVHRNKKISAFVQDNERLEHVEIALPDLLAYLSMGQII